MKTQEIRKKFTKYFVSKGHEHLHSSSLVPHNDPTLLFINAGMAQFKDFFTGKAKAKSNTVTTVQKCVRAGGKHNDLENVGFTSRHHTFFEMLGNFSFGDYFKKEAIAYAWEFLTKELKIDGNRLFISVHESDQEAADIWHKQVGIPKDRISFRDDKENFWEMGEVGPCGPSSEIFYDWGEEHTDPNADTSKCVLDDEGRYIEIWNLVFMQYERSKEDGKIIQRPLPKPCVDTGAGLERISAVLQNKYNNFDTDAFSATTKELENLTGKKYSDHYGNFRVIADHVRASTMLITDGVIPANEGRGYVLRRIIRRAARQLEELGIRDITLYKLVPAVFTVTGDEYPENLANKSLAEKYLKIEEENFRRTLSTGLELLNKEISKMGKVKTLTGDVIFKLYDTYGFPVDLTTIILQEKGLEADITGFEKEMKVQKERSKKAGDFSAQSDNLKEFYDILEKHGPTNFLGYEETTTKGKLVGSVNLDGNKCALVFDQTPFYGESGGQAGDTGFILKDGNQVAKVENTQKPVDGLHVHICEGQDLLKEGDTVNLQVDQIKRSLTARNHTATHLLQAALIKVLGDHIKQAGSFVGPERLRFDFTHPEAVKKDELKQIESIVNREIQNATSVNSETMTKDQAMKKGAMALFGEKYGDKVRVIDVPGFSLELCGGTHISNTSEIGMFSIVAETSLSAGVRRIEAVASDGAHQRLTKRMKILETVEQMFKVKGQDLVERLEQVQKDLKNKQKEIQALKEKVQSAASGDLFGNPEKIANGMVFKMAEAPDDGDLRKLGDLFLDKNPKGVLCLHGTKGDKTSVMLKTFKGNKEINCSDILKTILSDLGGRGGGKPDMAQGSFDASKASELEGKVRSALPQ